MSDHKATPAAEVHWEAGFRASIDTARQARQLAATSDPAVVPWWRSLIGVCESFIERPMPGRFAPLGHAITSLLQHAVEPALREAIGMERPLDRYRGYLRTSSESFDFLLAALAKIDKPAPRKRETVAELLALDPPLSRDQFLKMAPHVTAEQYAAWEEWHARRMVFSQSLSKSRTGEFSAAMPTDPEPVLPEFPPEQLPPEPPPILAVQPELAELVADVNDLFAEATESETPYAAEEVSGV